MRRKMKKPQQSSKKKRLRPSSRCSATNWLDDVTPDTVQPLFKKIQKGLKVKGKFVYMPIRVAVTGVMHGPDLNVIVALMGRDKVLARLDETLA